MSILVVVDVQKEYSSNFDVEYLNRLNQYIKINRSSYEKIIVIFQDPELLEKQEGIQTTPVLAKFADQFIEKWFYDIDDDWLEMTKIDGNPFSLNDKGVLEDTLGNIIVSVKHDNNDAPDDFLPPYALTQLAKPLGETTTVTLCGGAKGHCLADVKAVFDYFGCHTEIIDELTYSLQKSEELINEYNWANIPQSKTVWM